MRTIFFLAALVAVLAMASDAAANGPGYTRGDAEALFNAWPTGGDIIRANGQAAQGAAVAELGPLTMHFTLDGAPLTTSSTAIKRATAPMDLFGVQELYAQTTGTILAPDALAVGPHTIRLVMDNSIAPGVPEDFGDVPFFVDGRGTGVCV